MNYSQYIYIYYPFPNGLFMFTGFPSPKNEPLSPSAAVQVINNMVGFTTDPRAARSSYHCTRTNQFFSGGPWMKKSWEHMGKHGKIMGKSWENMGKSWENMVTIWAFDMAKHGLLRWFIYGLWTGISATMIHGFWWLKLEHSHEECDDFPIPTVYVQYLASPKSI